MISGKQSDDCHHRFLYKKLVVLERFITGAFRKKYKPGSELVNIVLKYFRWGSIKMKMPLCLLEMNPERMLRYSA
jgi:hypothetical protein